MEILRFTPAPITIDAAAPDGNPRRTIMGLAVPYNVDATTADGTTVRFLPGSMPTDGRPPVLLQYHDVTRPIGVVTSRVEILEGDAPGMYFEARISDTVAGSESLILAMDNVLTGVSVGATPTAWSYDKNSVMIVSSAKWSELSLVPLPAFETSRIHQIAAASGNNETEPEPETDAKQSETLTEETETMSENIEAATVEAATPVTPLWAQARSNVKLPSPSEYMAAFAAGSTAFAEMNSRIAAAAPDITTASTPGILPEVITGGVFDGLNPIRPFVTAIGTKAMPSAGATFRRPKITVRPVVTQQPTGQLTALDPSTVTVANNDVSKLSFGTYVTVSEQDLDWSDPASINIIIEQLAIAYGQATDNYAVDNCLSQIVQSETITADTPEVWVPKIYSAARQISESSNYLPTHIVCTPTQWAAFGAMLDDQNRPVFPFVGAPGLAGQNALGNSSATSWNGNPLGLNLVVDKNAGGSFIGHMAGPAAGYEFYEQMKGAISIDVPQVMGRTISFRGYAAGFMADATKFVKFV